MRHFLHLKPDREFETKVSLLCYYNKVIFSFCPYFFYYKAIYLPNCAGLSRYAVKLLYNLESLNFTLTHVFFFNIFPQFYGLFLCLSAQLYFQPATFPDHLRQGGPTSALLWATFQNYSSLRASAG